MANQSPTPTPADFDNLAQALRSPDPVLKAQAHAVVAKMPPDMKNTFLSGASSFTPDMLAPPALVTPLANAIAAPAADATAKVVNAAKAAISTGTPVIKYEATKQILKHIGVPESLATVAAIAVSGYKRGGASAAPAAAEAAPAEAAPADEALADVSPPEPAAGMGRSAFNDAMAEAVKKAKGAPAAATESVAEPVNIDSAIADAKANVPVLGKDVMAVKAAADASKIKLTALESQQAMKWLGQGVPAEKVWERISAARDLSASETFSPMAALKKAIDLKDNRKVTGKYLP